MGVTLQRRTLWEAVDWDRGKWWFFGAYLVLAAVCLGFVSWLWAQGQGGHRSTELLLQIAAALAPAALLPLARRKAMKHAGDSLGVVALPDDVFPDTSSALHDMALASGELSARLQVFASEALNAFVRRANGATHVAISTAFTRLPTAEQRAAFALMLGRNRVAIDSLVVGAARNGMPVCEDGSALTREMLESDSRVRSRIALTYLDVAAAGDREALLLLKEPAPMLTLLARLVTSDRTLPHVEVAAVYTCLAWPFAPLGVTGNDSRKLSPGRAFRANQALAAAAPGIADTELLRLERLKLVLPAAETIVAAPGTLPARKAPAESQKPAPISPAARAHARAEAIRERANAPRVAVVCPKCRANNAPINHRCIACGAALSR